ncbi:thermonuclease family protein [soil metagenome]
MERRFRPGVIVGLTLIAIVLAVLIVRFTGGPAASTPTQTAVPAGTEAAVVDYVHDGDTLFLEDGRKVRLLGIDTPEIGDHAECYGDEAKALLRTLLPKGTQVQVLADVQPLDRYGRSLLFIYTDDGTNINLELIEAGAAEAVVLKPNVMFASQLETAEDRAQAAGRGMWGQC